MALYVCEKLSVGVVVWLSTSVRNCPWVWLYGSVRLSGLVQISSQKTLPFSVPTEVLEDEVDEQVAEEV